MPRYDASRYDPPAPIVEVSLRRSDTSLGLEDQVLMLLDTGADITLLPRWAVERLELAPDSGQVFEVVGFDGKRSNAESVQLDMIFLRRAFRGRYLLIDDDRGILGRDVIANVALLLDGPNQTWEEVVPSGGVR